MKIVAKCAAHPEAKVFMLEYAVAIANIGDPNTTRVTPISLYAEAVWRSRIDMVANEVRLDEESLWCAVDGGHEEQGPYFSVE
jgi:hypothetical protein